MSWDHIDTFGVYDHRRKPQRQSTTNTNTEREALCARIDELCEQVEALKRDEWSAGFNAGCDAVNAAIEEGKAHYEVENAKLRELAAKMAKALRVGSEWCDRECIVAFGCDGMDECLIAKELLELGVEVDG